MARSLAGMIVSEMNKADNQRKREALRIAKECQKERLRIENAKQMKLLQEESERNWKRMIEDQERIVNSRNMHAEEMTKKLLDTYETYINAVDIQSQDRRIFDFQSLKKKYRESRFVYTEATPIKVLPPIEIANVLPVPAEKWTDKIFKSKKRNRLSIIEQNQRNIEETDSRNKKNAELVEMKFREKMFDYEERKKHAKSEWEKSEKQKKEEIIKYNEKIDEWNNLYLKGNEEAFISYINVLNDLFIEEYAVLEGHQISYNKYCKKLVVNLHISETNDLFEVKEYIFFFNQAIFKPIKYKVGEITERKKGIMIELCIAAICFLYKNDTASQIDKLIVNIFCENVCGVSGEVTKDSFAEYNFNSKNEKMIFLENQMRVFKQKNRGVKPFESLYIELESGE